MCYAKTAVVQRLCVHKEGLRICTSELCLVTQVLLVRERGAFSGRGDLEPFIFGHRDHNSFALVTALPPASPIRKLVDPSLLPPFLRESDLFLVSCYIMNVE